MTSRDPHDRALEDAEAVFHARLYWAPISSSVYWTREKIEAELKALGEIREELPRLREEIERLKRNQRALGSETPEIE
jgi:septation ring formation regulator EzrA